MGFISFASLVSWYDSQEFCVKKDSEAQRVSLMINSPGFGMRGAAACVSDSGFEERFCLFSLCL